MYGSTRPKRTMLGFNAAKFAVINNMCTGVSAVHKHDKWGIHVQSNKFATALETAYPTPLARAIASQFLVALQNQGNVCRQKHWLPLGSPAMQHCQF
jgi:hypothetical protein